MKAQALERLDPSLPDAPGGSPAMTQPLPRLGKLWAVVLAGGEGERLRPLIRRWLGRHQPKQYCTFAGTRSMFQHTVDRALGLAPPGHVITVMARSHHSYVRAQLDGRLLGAVLLQPENRDTAAGIFLPLAYIRAQGEDATVVIFPSDHFVHPEPRFLEVVADTIRTAERLTDRLVLLAVKADQPEREYGWIEPGENLIRSDPAVRMVQRFLEKPSAAEAMHTMAGGGLWNTLILTSKVETLWTLGWHCFPEMMPLFEQLVPAIGTAEETLVIEHIYRRMPRHNFSSGLLQRVPEQIVVVEARGMLWSDWGNPERIADTLLGLGRVPAFPLNLIQP